MAIRRGIISQPNVVKIDSRLPKGAVMTGESLPTGKPVLQEMRVVTERRVRKGPDGTVLHWPNAQGGPSDRPAYERVVVRQEPDIYVEAEMDNGMAWKNRHFRPSEEELARRKAAEDREAALVELGDVAGEMRSEGLNLRDLIDVIRGRKKVALPEQAPQTEQRATVTPAPKREPVPAVRDEDGNVRAPEPVQELNGEPRMGPTKQRRVSEYQLFVGECRKQGMSWADAAEAWRQHKEERAQANSG